MDEEKEMSFGERLEGYLVEGCRTAAMEKAADLLNGNDFRDYLKGVVSDEVACQLRVRQEDTEGRAENKTSGDLLTERQKRVLLRSGFACLSDEKDTYATQERGVAVRLVTYCERGLFVLFVEDDEEFRSSSLHGLVERMLCSDFSSTRGGLLCAVGRRILRNFIDC